MNTLQSSQQNHPNCVSTIPNVKPRILGTPWSTASGVLGSLLPCAYTVGQRCAIPLFNIRILSVSVKNYPYPYPFRSDIVNCYPYPIRIRCSNYQVKSSREDGDVIPHCSCVPPTICVPVIPRGQYFVHGTSSAHVTPQC